MQIDKSRCSSLFQEETYVNIYSLRIKEIIPKAEIVIMGYGICLAKRTFLRGELTHLYKLLRTYRLSVYHKNLSVNAIETLNEA